MKALCEDKAGLTTWIRIFRTSLQTAGLYVSLGMANRYRSCL